ncbi:MAG: hypothetical protein OEV78_01815 [Spirochaetia bacterium]|nr:hypothetical protein [Spirochaetia bacterium]
MADDDKVKDLIQISKDRFLPKEVSDQDVKPQEYFLDKEFAKTKKAFDWKFYSILLIFLLVVIGGTIIITTIVEIQNQKTQYSFNIEDINLQEQISSTKREEKNVNLAKEKLNKVIKEKTDKIKIIEDNYTLEIEKAGKSSTNQAEIKTKIDGLKTAKASDIKKINIEYEPLISKEEENVAKAEKDFDTKKAKLEQDINKADKIVNNYKKLQQMQIAGLKRIHEIEMDNLKLRYNPVFTEEGVREIIRSSLKMKLLDKPMLKNIEGLTRNRVITESEYKTIRSKIEDYQKIVNRMQKIPYTNSVDPALKVMQNDTYFLISEYERIMSEMLINLEILQKYQRAFNQITEFSVDNGIIIDASNSTDVIYSIKPVVQIDDGDVGLIFRKSDEYIGTITFEMKYGKLVASISDIVPSQKMMPLDKIFVKKKAVVIPEKTESIKEGTMKSDTKPVEKDLENTKDGVQP